MNASFDPKRNIAPEFFQVVATVARYLQALEARNIEQATACLADGFESIGPGGYVSPSIDGIVANSAKRYRRIGKHISHYDAFAAPYDVTVVYCLGTLHGVWPDGREFSGIRFIDRFELKGGYITRQDVWNDRGEHCLREMLSST